VRRPDLQRFEPLRRFFRAYSAHGTSDLAALLTYFGFLALFPMLLAGITVLGIVLRHNPELQSKVLSSSLVQFPVIGEDLRTNVQGLPGVTGLVTGLVLALLGARGFCLGLQRAIEVIWAVPKDKQPSWLSAQLRTFKLIAVAGLGVVGSTAGTATATTSVMRLLLLLVVVPGTGLMLLLALRVTAPDVVPTRDLAVAAAFGGVGLVALQVVGSQLVQHMTTSRAVYGTFAAILGLLAWIHLQVQVMVIGLEIGHLVGESRRDVSPAPAPQRRDRPSTRHTPSRGRQPAGRPTGGW
jgi:YihY family inner membrane protein